MIEWKYNHEFESEIVFRRFAQSSYKGAAMAVVFVEALDDEFPIYLSNAKDLFTKTIKGRARCRLRMASQPTVLGRVWNSSTRSYDLVPKLNPKRNLAIEEVFN